MAQINLIVSGVEQWNQNAYELAFMILEGFLLSLLELTSSTMTDQATATADQKPKAIESAAKAFREVYLLKNTDSKRFLSLFNDLGQDMIKKRDNFPRNSVEAFDMLDRWKPTDMMLTDKYKPNTRIGHMYVQKAEPP